MNRRDFMRGAARVAGASVGVAVVSSATRGIYSLVAENTDEIQDRLDVDFQTASQIVDDKKDVATITAASVSGAVAANKLGRKLLEYLVPSQ